MQRFHQKLIMVCSSCQQNPRGISHQNYNYWISRNSGNKPKIILKRAHEPFVTGVHTSICIYVSCSLSDFFCAGSKVISNNFVQKTVSLSSVSVYNQYLYEVSYISISCPWHTINSTLQPRSEDQISQTTMPHTRWPQRLVGNIGPYQMATGTSPALHIPLTNTVPFCKIVFLPNAHNRYTPDSKVHGANMGRIWGRQDPGGPHVGPMNFAI